MIKAHIDIALPEEAAGAAYKIVKKELIEPFADISGEGRLREHDWSLNGRIRTNGQVIEETIEMAGGDPDGVLLKGPGITPTREQVVDALKESGDDRRPEDLSKLATGTPNGYMRGHWLVKGNLERYENPGFSKLIDTVLPDYAGAGKIETLFPAGGRMKDAQCVVPDDDVEVSVEFNHKLVRGPEKLSAGSPVFFKTTKRAEIEALCRQAVERGKEIVFMSKYTVRPELDGEKKKIYNDVREAAGLDRREGNCGDIVDAAFARLLTRPVKDDMTVLVPDPSYGPKVAAVLKAVYEKGVKKPADDFSVCRFSAGKSEYGGLNKTVQTDGFFRVSIGGRDIRVPVKAGDMFEEMHYDYADAVRYVRQVFDQAGKKNYQRVVFAFDETDPFDVPVVKAARDEALHRKRVEGEDFFIMPPDQCAVKMFTDPFSGKTCYAYDNLWGDIVSDAMDLGASIASVNSVILLADGRVWPEMGGAGTAPDLMEKAKRDGFLRYDPVPIIEGLSIAFTQAAAREPENGLLAAYAKGLHDACADVLAEGIATPDLVDKLKSETKTGVDTESFVRAVRIRLTEKLRGPQAAAAMKDRFKNEMREIR